MQKIVPNLWFDHIAPEAVEFYTAVFPDTRIVDTHHYPTENLPDFQVEFAGQVLEITFEVAGYQFLAINAGSEFRVNQAVSFMLNFDPSRDPDARAHLDEVWQALVDGGRVLMPLDTYPFSAHYGWVEDKYNVTWQLILTNPEGEPRPFIVPTMRFGAAAQNQAGEAQQYFTSLFPGSRVGADVRYDAQAGPADRGQ